MKRQIIFSFALFLLFLSTSAICFAQTNRSLRQAINRYSGKAVLYLNQTGSMGKYRVDSKNTFFSDVDGDRDFDAVVEIFFCELTSCHPTTKSSKLAIFLNNKGNYRFVTDKDFTLYGKIKSVDGGKIVIGVFDLEDGDPQCCPEQKRVERYEFRRNKLIRRK